MWDYRAAYTPQIVNTFLSSNESLLQWWLDGERDGIIAMTLHKVHRLLPSYHTYLKLIKMRWMISLLLKR